MATANTAMKNSAPTIINPIIAPIMLIICILLPEGVHLHVRLLHEGASLPPFAGRLTLLDLLCTIVLLTIVPQYSILEPQWTCTLPSSVGAFMCKLQGAGFSSRTCLSLEISSSVRYLASRGAEQ